MLGWEDLAAQCKYDEIAQRLIASCADFDIDGLRHDAFGVLSASDELTVSVEDSLVDDDCGGGGYYRPAPPTIYLHPTIWRRDNFTLLHELGHHVQAHHAEWGYVLLDMSTPTRRKVEEAVCNSFAAQMLMPWNDENLDSSTAHPADVMAGFFETSVASRSAALQRVKGLLPASAKWLLAVADLDGVVRTSGTVYSDAPPAKGARQNGFAHLAREAAGGPVRRGFTEGIEYRNGSILDDMRAEAVLDHEGRYIFVALTPLHKFGTGTLVYPSYECSNPTCERSFSFSEVGGLCELCEDRRCPHCRRCGCVDTAAGATCPSCFMRLSTGEIANGTHECW